MMRPGDGISPMDIDLYLNKQIATNLPEGHKISKNDFIL
jgi:sialic acid synthase SpsE